MPARIGPDRVTFETGTDPLQGSPITAYVQGQKRTFVVDRNPAWSDDWLCSCGHAPDCTHIRAVKEALNARGH